MLLFSPTVPGGLISALFLLATEVLADPTDVATIGTVKSQIYKHEESTEAMKVKHEGGRKVPLTMQRVSLQYGNQLLIYVFYPCDV
jgi:hypothetical protein